MSRRNDRVLPGQLLLFPEEELQERCPLCRSTTPLTTCRRLYAVQRACATCAAGLQRFGWKIVR
jgi:hypothetical protein